MSSFTDDEKQEMFDFINEQLKQQSTKRVAEVAVKTDWSDVKSLPVTDTDGNLVRLDVSALGTAVEAVEATKVATNAANAAVTATETAIASAETKTNTAVEAAETATAAANTAAEKANAAAELNDFLSYNAPEGYVGAYESDEQSDPTPVASYGSASLLERIRFYLVNCEDNAGPTLSDYKMLMPGNFLRYADGSYAPVVGITSAMATAISSLDAGTQLFDDDSLTGLICTAGEFDATTIWETYGNDVTELYYTDGSTVTSVHVLRPWETTETKYTIVAAFADQSGNPIEVYPLDKVQGASGKYWKGILGPDAPHIWDGIDISKYKLAKTGIFPCPITTVGGKARAFFYLYKVGDSNTYGGKGTSSLCSMFDGSVQNRTYPRVSDMQQVTTMQRARANNATTTNPYPFAEGGYHAFNTFITALETRFATRYLHNPSLFGAGICSNNTCNSEATWLANGGVRCKVSGAASWTYYNFNSQGMVYYNASAQRTHFSALLNGERPKEQCMESQMAASYAAECGIAENTEFEFYGSTYRYVNVPGGTALLDGGMDVRVYKVMSATISAYNSSKEATDFDIEVCLRMSLYSGLNLAGDIFTYQGGGHEIVVTNTNYTSSSGQSGANTAKAYLEPDQTKWLYETSFSKNNLGTFPFEDEYELMAEGLYYNGYYKNRFGFVALAKTIGGALNTYECGYHNGGNYYSSTLNQRVRVASRFRGIANNSNASARYLIANYAASTTHASNGGSAQVLLA